jgi:hypothetical protein
MNTRFVLLAVLLIACFVPASALGQEYVRNGTFDTLYAFDWQTGGQAWDPGNKSFPVASVSPDQCFGLVPADSGYSIWQDIDVPPSIQVVAKLDIAAALNANYWYQYPNPSVSFSVSGQALHSISQHTFSRENALRRLRLEQRIVTPPSGRIRFTVSFRGVGAPVSAYPALYVDNASLTPCSGATVHPYNSYLELGAGNGLTIYTGTPGPIQLYVAPARLNTGLALAGWGGTWSLDPNAMIHALSFGIDTSGYANSNFTVPNVPEIRGLPVYWQCLHAATTQVPPVLHLGTVNAWSFF